MQHQSNNNLTPRGAFQPTPLKSQEGENRFFNFHPLSTVPQPTPTPSDVKEAQRMWGNGLELKVPTHQVSYSRVHYPLSSLTPGQFRRRFSPPGGISEYKEERMDKPMMTPRSLNKRNGQTLDIELNSEVIVPEEGLRLDYSPLTPLHLQSQEQPLQKYTCTLPAHQDSHGYVLPTLQRVLDNGTLELPFITGEVVYERLDVIDGNTRLLEWNLDNSNCVTDRCLTHAPYMVLGEVLPACQQVKQVGNVQVDRAYYKDMVPRCMHRRTTVNANDYKYILPQAHCVITEPDVDILRKPVGDSAYATSEVTTGSPNKVSITQHKVPVSNNYQPLLPRLQGALPICYARSILMVQLAYSRSSVCADSIGIVYYGSKQVKRYKCHLEHLHELPQGQPTIKDPTMSHNNAMLYVTCQRKGSRRTQQDAHVAVPIVPGTIRDAGVYTVTDGHGYDGGTLSAAVAETLASQLSKVAQYSSDRRFCGKVPLQATAAIQAMLDAYKLVLAPQFPHKKGCQNGGCAAVAAYINGRDRFVAIGYIGDSRAVLQREKKVIYSTIDHTAENVNEASLLKQQGAELVTSGSGTRVNGVLALSRSIGDERYPLIRHEKIEVWPWQPEDQLLLVSDGVWSGTSTCSCDEQLGIACVCTCEDSMQDTRLHPNCLLCGKTICSYCVDPIYMYDTAYGDIPGMYETYKQVELDKKKQLGRTQYHQQHQYQHQAVLLAQKKTLHSLSTPCQKGRPIGDDQNWIIDPITSVKRIHSVWSKNDMPDQTPKQKRVPKAVPNSARIFGLSQVQEGDEEEIGSAKRKSSCYSFESNTPKSSIHSAQDHCACPVSISKFQTLSTANASGSDNVTVTCIQLGHYIPD